MLFSAGSQNNFYLFGQVFLYFLASISEGLQALGGNLNYFTGAGDKLPSVLNLEGLTLNTASFSSSDDPLFVTIVTGQYKSLKKGLLPEAVLVHVEPNPAWFSCFNP